MTASADQVSAGGTIAIEVLHRNDTAEPVAAVLGEGSVLVMTTELGHEIPPRDAWAYSEGRYPCSPAPVGRSQPQNYDMAAVVIRPGGALHETFEWHAGRPERDGLTCGWNYTPLQPGLYRVSLQSAEGVFVWVRVVAAGPKRGKAK
jgi:hypothetical protein